MHTWLKQKYAADKPAGSHKSKHNDNTKRRAQPRRKLNDKERAAQQARQPLVTLVLLANGKKRFVREPRDGGTS